MRSLQRHENVLPISSVNEIVDYISNNYNNDGDLYTQVRTALKQLLKEGLVRLNAHAHVRAYAQELSTISYEIPFYKLYLIRIALEIPHRTTFLFDHYDTDSSSRY